MGRKRGLLTCVGTGITLGDATPRITAEISRADKVLYLGADPLYGEWIRRFHPRPESLYRYYRQGKPRWRTYDQMVQRILRLVRQGHRVCVAMYGHPGIFVNPTHAAIRQARRERFSATMLPGLSADGYLYADLGIDPAEHGSHSYDATYFVVCRRKPDPTATLLLWQIGLIGRITLSPSPHRAALKMLQDDLVSVYGPDHTVYLYEASLYPICKPTIGSFPLSFLSRAEIPPVATLYVPAASTAQPDPGRLKRLNLA